DQVGTATRVWCVGLSTWDGAEVDPRLRRFVDVALIVLAAGLRQVLLILGRLVTPADGTATFPSAPPWGDGVEIVSVAGGDHEAGVAGGDHKAGVAGGAGDLRAGDRVVSV